jgi:hypothetical protein
MKAAPAPENHYKPQEWQKEPKQGIDIYVVS